MNTNPIIGFFRTLGLFITGRVQFGKEEIGNEHTMEDGAKFTVFRRAKIKARRKGEPQAVFKIRFKPENMSVQRNIKFSRFPMMIFMGFTGFRSKYWMVNYESGVCQGIYEWQTYEDALNYSKSIAVNFMTRRSMEGSVNYEIIKQCDKKYFPFERTQMMKINDCIIIYFSATGNTHFVAEEIKKYFISEDINVDLISAEDLDEIKNTDFQNKLLGIGFPCYAFDYSHEVLDKALDCITLPKQKMPAFIFTTYCIDDGISRKEMAKQLKKRNFTTVETGGFKCPSSGFYTVKSGDERGMKKKLINKVTSFDNHIKSKIEVFSHNVLKKLNSGDIKQVKIIKPNFISLLPKCFAKWNEKRIFTGYKIDYSKCTTGGKCMENCPADNFRIVDNRMEFVNNSHCLRCMRCINNCPNDAITLGRDTEGKLRYNNEARTRAIDELK